MPRPQLHPTDEQRKMVKSLAAFGLTQYQVAGIIGIRSPKTLRKYFRAELDLGDLEGYAKVQQTHFQMATDGEHWPATKSLARFLSPTARAEPTVCEVGIATHQNRRRCCQGTGYSLASRRLWETNALRRPQVYFYVGRTAAGHRYRGT